MDQTKRVNLFSMKARIAVIGLLMTITTAVNAQFYMGARAGVNLANQSTNAAGTENAMKLGLCGGLTVKAKVSKYLLISLDPMFSQMGTNSTTTLAMPGDFKIITESAVTFNYIQVPLMLNAEWPIQSKRLMPYRQGGTIGSFHICGGGFFGYALGLGSSSTTTLIAPLPTVDGEPKTPDVVTQSSGASPDSLFSPIDFGAVAGLGFSFQMDPRNSLCFDVRYLMGFGNTEGSAITKRSITTTNSAIQLSVAYIYRLTVRNIRR